MGPPMAVQIDFTTVLLRWNDLVTNRECVDSFLVKYWEDSNPNDYQLSAHYKRSINAVRIGGLTPRVSYTFQLVAREDKGLLLGVDWNRSPLVRFTTSVKPVSRTTAGVFYPTATTMSPIFNERMGKSMDLSMEDKMIDIPGHNLNVVEDDQANTNWILVIVGISIGCTLVVLPVAGFCYKYAPFLQPKSDVTQTKQAKSNFRFGNDLDSDFDSV